MTNAYRDENDVPTLIGVSSADGVTPTRIAVNPVTGRVLVDLPGGTGVTSINGDSTATQTLSVGTAGTNFAIADNGSGGHTFNLPTASATNRGALSSTDWTTFNNKGSGTVTTVSVASANGFAGSVANPTTTPAISVSTSITGLLKGNGTAVSAGVAGDVDTILPTQTGNNGKVLTTNGTASSWATAGIGDMVLASTQTNTGAKTFNAGTLLDKGEIVFDVKAYGATGNGSTNDTAAIQSAIDACNTAGGGIVWFPKGTYKLVTNPLKLYSGTTPTIVPYSNITLLGAGSSGVNGSIITQTTTGVDCIKGLNDVANDAQALNNSIKNLAVVWGTATLTNSGNGIYLAQQAAGGPSFQQWNFENVVASGFQGSGKYGFNFESVITSTVDTCQAVSCANGFYINGAVGGDYNSVSTSITYLNCYANMATNGVIGFNNLDNTYISYIGCAVDIGANSTGVAYYSKGSSGISYNACGCELDGTHTLTDMWKIEGCSGVGLYNNYSFQSNASIDVYVTGSSTGVTIIGHNDNSTIGTSTGLKVDAGSQVTEMDNNWGGVVTPRNIASTGIDYQPGQVRVLSAASYTTNTGTSINSGTQDMFIVTAQTGALKFNNPTGTPQDGQKLTISVASSTTAARALTWDTAYSSTTIALPTTTAATTATLTIGFIWSAAKSLWQCIAVA